MTFVHNMFIEEDTIIALNDEETQLITSSSPVSEGMVRHVEQLLVSDQEQIF